MEREADIWIGRAEQLWLERLERNARQVFSSTWLPSHDHTHHQRVWNICRRMILEMERSKVSIDYSLVEGILIAAWFHDLGMAQVTGEKHGARGRALCENYLQNSLIPPPARYHEIIEAVESHDIKDARIHDGIRSGETAGILPVLAVADDLEALGVIGIYRYIEIYLLRGTGMDRLGDQVLHNVEHRMENITSCRVCGETLRAFEAEKVALTRFFEAYVKQCSDPLEIENLTSGPAGVVNRIRSLGLEQHLRPEEMAELITREGTDEFVKQYFNQLHHDWIHARR